ncbi:uncharacterized protein LOC143277971 [Babylonia areolata]|uniref:uncharacterized protein LOC143277971 n=1 Tax=Babylonia areolata TaxID=304850 RepID=UPI003FD43ACB
MDLSMPVKVEPEDYSAHYGGNTPDSLQEDSKVRTRDLLQQTTAVRGGSLEGNVQSSLLSGDSLNMAPSVDDCDSDTGVLDLSSKVKVDVDIAQPFYLLGNIGEHTQGHDVNMDKESSQPHTESCQPLNLCMSASQSSVADQDHSGINIKQEPSDSDYDSEEVTEDLPPNRKRLRIKLADIKKEPESVPSSEKVDDSEEFWRDWSSRAREAKREQYGGRDEKEFESLPVHFSSVKSFSSTNNNRSETPKNLRSPADGGDEDDDGVAINVRLYQCGVCAESFENPAQFKVHMVQHNVSSRERPVRCGACLKAFRYCSDLIQHTVVHTRERNHQCQVCQATFTKASSLKGHMKVHTGERPFECSYCPSRFKHSSHLKEHERTHTGEKPYQCEFCQVRFTSSSQLKLHRKIHTGGRRFKCDQCSVEFNQLLHLQIHRRIHTGEKPFRCEACDLSYRYKSSLKSHILKVHSKERHRCGQCEASFNTPEALAKHEKSHQGNRKTYTCEECSASFLTAVSLTHHRWSHTGEKPFKCEFCPAGFRDHTSFKRHKMIHVGERAFKCEHCCASFRLMSHLSCHMKIHCEQPKLSPPRQSPPPVAVKVELSHTSESDGLPPEAQVISKD